MSRKTSYLGAFLQHPLNWRALQVAAVLGIFASIPMGWAGPALVGSLALGLEILGALFIPSLPSFRNRIDRKQTSQDLQDRRQILIAQLREQGESTALTHYQHMWERVQALHLTARDKKTALTAADVEKMDALTVDYLNMSAVAASLRRRKNRTSDDQLSRQIANLNAQLAQPHLPEDQARPLRATLTEYTEALNRSRRLAARRIALEASLLTMPDKMEEAYQLVITAPYSQKMPNDMGGKLDEALARLRIAEEVAAEFADPDPYESSLPSRAETQPATAHRSRAQRINT